MEMPAAQPSTSHSMGNLLTMPRQQNHVYQERLVDWNVDRVSIPGATVTQVEKAKTQYLNNYEFPNNAYQSQSIGQQHQEGNLPGQMKLLSSRPQIPNNSYLTMYPIDEAPHHEDHTRSRNHRSNNKRPIPIIQEPNQMFLTIPSHIERYPPYPVRNHDQQSSQIINDTPCTPQYGYYSKDKTELTFPALNRSCGSLNSNDCAETTRDTFSFESEPSIPYIDQLDENYQVSSRSEENILSSGLLDNDQHFASQFMYKSRDSNNLHINLMKCHHTSRTCPQLMNPRPSNALLQRSKEIDDRTIRTNSLDRNIGEIRLTTARSSLGDIDVSATTGNVIVTHCCCHGHLTHCQAHENDDFEALGKNSSPEATNVIETQDDSNESSESVDSRLDPIDHHQQDQSSPKKVRNIMPELNLDLSGLNSDVSSDDSNNREKCWRSPDEVRLGCGRVAALAKHFSKLGEAGLIKFKSIKLSASRQFVSEPEIASPRSPEISGHKRSTRKEYKSESDLSKTDKSLVTTPEKEWSLILLDIQTKNEIDMRSLYEKSDRNDESPDDEPGELKKSSSKLSLAEQQEIIQQLEEFANLDNADAPLFIPEHEEPISDYSKASGSSVKHTMTESMESLNNRQANAQQTARCSKIVGRMSFEHFRKHSLPTILSTFNVTPSLDDCCVKKVNKLEKYWSLKDLMSNDEDAASTDTPNDPETSPKYFIFPTCSRVVSAPEITNESINIFHTQSLNSSGNLTIRSTISISDEQLKEKVSDTSLAENSNSLEKSERASSPIFFRDSVKENLTKEPPKTKFPGSFIRTRKLSKSQDDLGEKKNSAILREFKGKPVARSLQKIPILKSDEIICSMSNIHESKNSTNREHCSGTANTSGTCRRREPASKLNSNYYNTIPIKSSAKLGKPVRKKSLIVRKKSKSDMDVSERKPTPRFERGDWIFRDFPPLEIDSESRKLARLSCIDVSALCLVQF